MLEQQNFFFLHKVKNIDSRLKSSSAQNKNMNEVIRYLLYGSCLLLFSSCASLFSGSTQHISIDSEPQGAEVRIGGQNIGTTPTTVRIKRRSRDMTSYGRSIILEKPGYKTHQHYIKSKVNFVSFLNLINLLFWGIDFATGALVSYDDYNYFNLSKEDSAPPQNLNKTPDNTPSKDHYQQLRELKKLLDEEILTQEEFQREKEKILNRNK